MGPFFKQLAFFALLYTTCNSNLYVVSICNFPPSYNGTWFQQYSVGPTLTDTWVYGTYNSTTFYTGRVLPGFISQPFACQSSYTDTVNNIVYFILTLTLANMNFCAKAQLTTGGTALLVSEIQTTLSINNATGCVSAFVTDACFSASKSPCSAVWLPYSPLVLPPAFSAIQCPFQGNYQLSVQYAVQECVGNAASTVSVSGSAMTLNTCSGQTSQTLFKNQPILTQSLTCLGNLPGLALNPAEAAAGVNVLLLMSSNGGNGYTIYCAKYNVSTSGNVLMSIDVNQLLYANCGSFSYNTYQTTAGAQFLSLSMTNTASSTSSTSMPSSVSSITTTTGSTTSSGTTVSGQSTTIFSGSSSSTMTPTSGPLVPTSSGASTSTMTPTSGPSVPTSSGASTSTMTPTSGPSVPTSSGASTSTMTPTSGPSVPTSSGASTSTMTPTSGPPVPTSSSASTSTMTPTSGPPVPTSSGSSTSSTSPTSGPTTPVPSTISASTTSGSSISSTTSVTPSSQPSTSAPSTTTTLSSAQPSSTTSLISTTPVTGSTSTTMNNLPSSSTATGSTTSVSTTSGSTSSTQTGSTTTPLTSSTVSGSTTSSLSSSTVSGSTTSSVSSSTASGSTTSAMSSSTISGSTTTMMSSAGSPSSLTGTNCTGASCGCPPGYVLSNMTSSIWSNATETCVQAPSTIMGIIIGLTVGFVALVLLVGLCILCNTPLISAPAVAAGATNFVGAGAPVFNVSIQPSMLPNTGTYGANGGLGGGGGYAGMKASPIYSEPMSSASRPGTYMMVGSTIPLK